jgi:hypothetical protein
MFCNTDQAARSSKWTSMKKVAARWSGICQIKMMASQSTRRRRHGGLGIATFITLLLVSVLLSVAVFDLRIIRWELRQVTPHSH